MSVIVQGPAIDADDAAWAAAGRATVSDATKLVSSDDLGTAAAADVGDFDAAGAAAAAQSYSIQRANHTGTQLANTISDFHQSAQASAQALLAGAAVQVGTTGAETEIALSTKNTLAGWKLRTWSAVYDGTRDDTFSIAYNYGDAHADTGKAGVTLLIEADYDYVSDHATEIIWQWHNPGSTVQRRPMQINIEYSTANIFTQVKGRWKWQNSASTLDTFEITETGNGTFSGRVAALAYDIFPDIPFIHEEVGYSVGVGRNTITTPPASGGAVAIGYEAGKTATGARGIYIGYRAGNVTVGDGNIHIGYEAGKVNTTGINILVGDRAGAAMVGATANTAVGYDALKSDVSNHLNTAVGYSALRATTGLGNTAVGGFAGDGGVGINNAAYFGYTAGKYETATGKLIIDTIDRTNEATSRTRALIYGVFNATVGSQEITFNCGKMGFFNQAAVPKPTGVAVTAEAIHAALVTLNLIAA